MIATPGKFARGLVALGCGVMSTACAPAARPVETTAPEWHAARARLSSLRGAEPEHSYGIVVNVALREPRTGRTFAARGGLAVDPHRAMRLILVGPGGSTALDAWVTPDAYRFEVPAIGLLRRGGAGTDPGLPIDFFRWWFLAPFDGRLIASFDGRALAMLGISSCEGRLYLLHSADSPPFGSTVSLCEETNPRSDGLIELAAFRRGGGTLDRLFFRGRAEPSAGDRAVYDETRSGVHVEVDVEALDAEPPDPLAFRDPDMARGR